MYNNPKKGIYDLVKIHDSSYDQKGIRNMVCRNLK